MSRAVFITAFTFFLSACASGRPSKPVWSLREGLKAPESAYYDPSTNLIYISNVSGSPFEKDGDGYISAVGLDGKIVKARWAQGLNAPKGMRSSASSLFVTDIDEVAEISLLDGTVKRKIPVPGAQFLNDLTLDEQGNLFVSDTMTGTIFLIRPPAEPEEFLKGPELESPNGLFIRGRKLYAASWGELEKPGEFPTKSPGHLVEIDLKTKAVRFVPTMLAGNLDGLEPDGKMGWYVSDWMAGRVMHVDKNGKVAYLIEGLKGSADIGAVPSKKLLLVPQMMADSLEAYRVK